MHKSNGFDRWSRDPCSNVPFSSRYLKPVAWMTVVVVGCRNGPARQRDVDMGSCGHRRWRWTGHSGHRRLLLPHVPGHHEEEET